MKFSNAALAALPSVAFTFTQLVSRTKAASTTGLQIFNGMVVELCEGSNITAGNGGDWSPALSVGDYSSNGGASLTITGGSYKATYYDGMKVYEGSNATMLGGTIQGGQYGGGMFVYTGAVATVLGGTIKGGLYDGMFVWGDGAVATVLGGTIQGGKYGGGMAVYIGAVATVLGGTIQGGLYGNGMSVYGAVATVLGGTIQGGQHGGGMSVDFGAVATVCDGTIQGGESGDGMLVSWLATVRIAGGMMIGGNYTFSTGYGFYNFYGDATITGGTFKGGFNSTSGDQASSLVLRCGNTTVYGGTYEGNWINVPYSDCYEFYTNTKVYGKDLVVEGNHLMGTLCDGNPIDVFIFGEPSTVYTENNCTSFPEFAECGGKGGKSGKKTKGTLFRP